MNRLTSSHRAVLLAVWLSVIAACGDSGGSTSDMPAVASPVPDEAAVEAPLTPADQDVLRQAAAAVQADRFEDVARLLGPLLARTPPPADAQFIAGSAAYDLGDYAEAVTRLSDATVRKPIFVPNSSALGFAQFKLGDFAGARASFERIVAVNDGAYKAHYGLGLVSLSEGRLPEARAHLERALALSPGYLKARFQMARLLQEEARLPEAAAALQAVLAEWPTHEEALYRLSQVLQALGREAEAAATMTRHAQVYKAREAIGGLTQRIRSGGDQPGLHAEIVRLWRQVGDTEEAARSLANGLRRFPGDPELEALQQAGSGHEPVLEAPAQDQPAALPAGSP